MKNITVSEDTVIFGEVGLSGEVRSVPQVQDRVKEAVKLGFKRIILPGVNKKGLAPYENIELCGISFISELFALL